MRTGEDWTSPEDIEAEVLKIWTKGRILAARINSEEIFPLRLRLRAPGSAALAARFSDARTWIRSLEAGSRAERGFGFDLAWRDVNHRQLGRNRLPSEIVIPSESDALRLIRKQADAKRFEALAIATASSFPELTPWLARKPLLALENSVDWSRILAVLAWFRDNPKSGLYLRQLDVAGVDTKFIETRRGLLSELLDNVLQQASGASRPTGAFGFEGRFGLVSKPATVRFRLLDGQTTFRGLTDISTPAADFAALDLSPRVVFITENEVNGLAFPPFPGGMVLFGLGYSLELLAKAHWLRRSRIVYWGDIDTHGFAMLDQLRSYFPTTLSLLMDEETLLAHRLLWVQEDRPFTGNLTRLSAAEKQLFEDLKGNKHGNKVRLEQERIAYRWVNAALSASRL